MKKPEIILRLLRIPLDFVVVLAAFLVAYYLRSNPELVPYVHLEQPLLLPVGDFVWFAIQAAILVVIIFAWQRMYSLRKSYRFRKELRKMVVFMAAAFTIIILYFFLVGIQFFSRFVLGLAFILSIVLMLGHRFILRLIQHWFWRRGLGKRRVLFVGEGKVLKELDKAWREALGYELVGRLVASEKLISSEGLKILGSYEDLAKVVRQYHIDEVVQVASVKNASDMVEFCQLHHVEYRFVPNMLEVQRTNTEIDFVHEIPIITLRSSAVDWWARVVKRMIDIIGSTIGLIVLSPVFLGVIIGIKLDSKGPVFYKSKRVSKNKKFWMWKFRSMVLDADSKKKDLLEMNRREGPLFKIKNDPRITKFGRFLRKSSLDELPQLWNVLKGDLSLVGPRAHLPEEIEQYEKHHRKVLAIKAGVTGLAQVSGRSKLDFEQEVKLDVYYLENWSFWLDIKIILRTFGVVFQGE